MFFTQALRGLVVIGNGVVQKNGDPDTWMPWLDQPVTHGVATNSLGVLGGLCDAEQLMMMSGGYYVGGGIEGGVEEAE